MEVKDMNDNELIAHAQSLHSSIFIAESFSTNDLALYDIACAELERRNYGLYQGLVVMSKPIPECPECGNELVKVDDHRWVCEGGCLGEPKTLKELEER